MTDFLDGELGEFDWGPPTRRHRLAALVQIISRGAAIHVVMVWVGALALTVGLTTAWASYQPPILVAPPVEKPPELLDSAPIRAVDDNPLANKPLDDQPVDVEPAEVDARSEADP